MDSVAIQRCACVIIWILYPINKSITSTQNVKSEAMATFSKFITSYDDIITMQSQYHNIIYSTSPKLQLCVLFFMIGWLAALKWNLKNSKEWKREITLKSSKKNKSKRYHF